MASESSFQAPYCPDHSRRWGVQKNPRKLSTPDDLLRALSAGHRGGSPKANTPAWERLVRAVQALGRS